MTTIIDSIKEWGIPITSHFEAQRNMQKNLVDYSQRQYENLIQEMTDVEFKASSLKEAELVANYLVIDSVKDHNNNISHLPSEALELAKKKANDFLAKNGWIVATSETTPSVPVADPVTGEVTNPAPAGKKRSGPSKKDQCVELYNKGDNKTKTRKELIEIFVKELGLTPAGASTYVHNCQKGLWK